MSVGSSAAAPRVARNTSSPASAGSTGLRPVRRSSGRCTGSGPERTRRSLPVSRGGGGRVGSSGFGIGSRASAFRQPGSSILASSKEAPRSSFERDWPGLRVERRRRRHEEVAVVGEQPVLLEPPQCFRRSGRTTGTPADFPWRTRYSRERADLGSVVPGSMPMILTGLVIGILRPCRSRNLVLDEVPNDLDRRGWSRRRACRT